MSRFPFSCTRSRWGNSVFVEVPFIGIRPINQFATNFVFPREKFTLVIFHNPPEGDRMDVVPFFENGDLDGLTLLGLWSFRFLQWFRVPLSLVRVRCWFWTFRLTVGSVFFTIGPLSVLVLAFPLEVVSRR